MNLNTSSKERWLITGGLGYIGAHVAREFIATGFKVFIADNLSTGIMERLPREANFIECDVRNSVSIRNICDEFGIDGIVHMAAFKHARESKLNPSKYFGNNLGGTLGLVEGMMGTTVRKFLFSSSCSIYGNASGVPENATPNPQSPYASSKWLSEILLKESLAASEVTFTALRFFNVIGCGDFPGSQDRSLECLIPTIADKMNRLKPISVYGTELETPDGTCIRDYLDVRDVASAHSIVARSMNLEEFPQAINVSSGSPISVKQVIEEFERILSKKLLVESCPSNPADPIAIWSQKSIILESLGWKPKYNLRDSISSHLQATRAYTKDAT
jgi:UDP-glucose 4-epimerase